MRDLECNHVVSELQDTEMGQHESNTQVRPFFQFARGCATDELRRCATRSLI